MRLDISDDDDDRQLIPWKVLCVCDIFRSFVRFEILVMDQISASDWIIIIFLIYGCNEMHVLHVDDDDECFVISTTHHHTGVIIRPTTNETRRILQYYTTTIR